MPNRVPPWASEWGHNGTFVFPGNWDYESKISKKTEVSSKLPVWFISCNNSLFAVMTLTVHMSHVRCSGVMQHAVVNLHFIHVRSFVCRGRLWNLRVDCSTVGVYCVSIAWSQIFKNSLHVTVAGVLLHVTVWNGSTQTLWQGNLFWKGVSCFENLQITWCVNYRNIPSYFCRKSAFLWLLP